MKKKERALEGRVAILMGASIDINGADLMI